MAGIIKQLATYDGNAWQIDDIGANANNISINSNTNLSDIIGNKKLEADKVVITNENGILSTSNINGTILSYLDGINSNIQEQINSINTNLAKYPDASEKEIYFENTKRIYGKTTEEQNLLALQPCNENNNLVIGYGGYDNQIGSTNIYGNKIYFRDSDGYLGRTYSATGTNRITTNNVDANPIYGASLTLPPGYYIIWGQWNFNSGSSSGIRNNKVVLTYTDPGTTNGNLSQTRIVEGASYYSSLQISWMGLLDAKSTIIKIGATSSIPESTHGSNYLRAIRLSSYNPN